ncbi:MAG: metallophosphoesterase [Sphingomonas sp.]|uniref:metallophosphoesterase family protein n=1 Tax=Sphingomonas sp. TaxID=28214 RepID=UPI0022756ACC|nr:metallophosphoesterase [Sphingomonas sp.]MCX8476743.1 metallophosphoesterase [Sphingomonas sp.]
MAAPAIALRFRDTTVGVDTIDEHRKLLDQTGRVGWGWWKKEFEAAEHERIFDLLRESEEVEIVLIDRSTSRAFRCACTAYHSPAEADPATVPSYYRDHLDETAGVFVMRSLADTDFDPALADAIGDQTFLWIGTKADPTLGHLAEPAQAPGRSCVLHLSDLHFGADYGFRLQDEALEIGDPRRTLTECVVEDLKRLGLENEIAAVIVTGDFMTNGKFDDDPKKAALAEFDALRSALRLERDQIIAVPGNHDVVRYPPGEKIDIRDRAVETQTNSKHEISFRLFVDELVGRDWKASLNYVRRIHLGDADLDVCVLNSCTVVATEWTEYGYVGRSGLDAIAELRGKPAERPTFRFLALHHHLLPVAGVEAPKSKGVTLTLDASDLLMAAQRAGVHVALHGHQHKPKITRYQNFGLNGEPTFDPIYVVANGSAGVRNARLPAGERNTYCLFRLDAGSIELWIRELRLDGAAGAQTFQGNLPASPLTS